MDFRFWKLDDYPAECARLRAENRVLAETIRSKEASLLRLAEAATTQQRAAIQLADGTIFSAQTHGQAYSLALQAGVDLEKLAPGNVAGWVMFWPMEEPNAES